MTKKSLFFLAGAILCLCVGLLLVLDKTSEKRILLPPNISSEILQQDQAFSCNLLVKQANSGVYQSVCRYALAEDGTVSLLEKNNWLSYVDTLSRKEYAHFRHLSSKTLTQAYRTDNGFLLIYHGKQEAPITVIETDSLGNVVFSYDFSGAAYTSPCETVFADKNFLYILSYNQNTDRLSVTSVHKQSGEIRTTGFTYAQLAGDEAEENRMGGFIFEHANLWLSDNILYFAENCWSENPGAVIAAWDLAAEQPVYYQKIDQAQIIKTYWQTEENRFFVLLNEKNFTPLTLVEFSLADLTEKSRTSLSLPPEFGPEYGYPESYYLFTGAMNAERIVLLFPDLANTPQRPDKLRRYILACYDTATGELDYRCRLSINATKEIYGLEMPENQDNGGDQ